MVVADEKNVEHIRELMVATAKSFRVNWEYFELYHPRGKVIPKKIDPLFSTD